MPSLDSLLVQVEGQFAHAFVVVGAGAFQLTGADGNRYEMPGVGADELSALVEGTLDQDQLTDLMVGRPVGLSLDVADARWRVLVEPGVSGLTVRGTRANPRVRQASQELEIELNEGPERSMHLTPQTTTHLPCQTRPLDLGSLTWRCRKGRGSQPRRRQPLA